MKKYLKVLVVALLVVVITGCGSKKLTKDASVDDLLDIYVDAFKNADADKLISVYPEFAKDYFSNYITNEKIQKTLDYFGDNVKISINVTGKEKLTDEELEDFNEQIKKTFSNYILPSECYKISGESSIKGSNEEQTSDIRGMHYCNFDGTWRLLGE